MLAEKVKQVQTTVYVTDDDPEFRSTIAKILDGTEYKFQIFASSDELVDALVNSDSNAIVFLDLHMERENGIATITRLQPYNQRIRLRFITGGARSLADTAQLIAKARSINVGETLYKPFPRQAFVDAISDDIGLIAR